LLDPGSMQERVTRLADFLVDELADLCVVEPEQGATPPYRRTAAWRTPELSTLAEELTRGSWQGVAGSNAVATAPLHGPRARHGGLLLVRTGPGASFTPAEEELVREVGRRAGTVAENALLHQEAMAAVSARDEVLSVVAHDLRGPLHTIAIASALLADSEVPEGKKAPQSDIIRRAIQQATELIEDLLESGRTGAGLNHVDPRPDEAVAIARQAVERRASVATAAGVHVQLHAPVGSVEILADRRRLLQALDNIIGNAIRFTPGGGTVTVVVEGAEDVVRFTVEDTGPGIRACDLERVFDRYWRARDGGGAGLGLAIARAVVQAHGGRIWAENGSPGRGARFAFEIPTVASATEAGIPASEESREGLPPSA
jgi:signal transduction histidine kinase